MGDPSAQTNGAAARAVVPDLLPGPSNGTLAMQRVRAARAATLADLEKGDLDAPAPKAKAAASKAPVAKAAAVEVEADGAETDDAADAADTSTAAADDAAGTDDADVEAGTDEPKREPAAAADPELSKRLTAIQKAEQRSRDKINAERAELETKHKKFETEWHPKIAAYEKFEAAKKNIHRDPASVLAELGIGDDAGREATARLLFSMTEAGKKDPAAAKAHAAQAERMLRDREHETELEATKRRLEELETKLTAKEQQAEFESTRAAYVELAVKAIGDSTPVIRALAEKNPAKLRKELWATTQRLITENDGEVPDAEEVAAEYEKTRRAELEELGIDPTTLSATTKKNNQAADKKHPAKTLGNDLSTPRVPRPTKSDREHRAETLAMLESGKLE